MQVHTDTVTSTEIKLTVHADTTDLNPLKDHVLQQFRSRVKVPGFREGKAPLSLVEKNADPATLQSEFVEEAVNHLYSAVIEQQKLRTVERPRVQLTKFVPYTELEFVAEVSIIGQIKLGDYKKIKKSLVKTSVTAKDVSDVLKSLRQRSADRNEVKRPAKYGDEVVIDFKGQDQKGEAVNGADGQDYPLILGSDTFIPGFEKNLIGIKAGEEKTFTLTFPRDYGVKAMQNKKVTFVVKAKKVHELKEPEIDDKLAAKVSPFKSLTELKADIKKQVAQEKQTEIDRKFENELVDEIVSKSHVVLPEILINEQIEILLGELQQNLTYRGQTFPEFLKAEGQTEDEYRKNVLKPQADQRVKAGLVLSEIAEREGLSVTPEELEVQMQVLRGQYQDQAMQAELAKPEARRDIASRILTKKTIDRLRDLVTK